MFAEFQAHTQIDLKTADVANTHGLIRTLHADSIKNAKRLKISGEHGVYVFSLRNGGGNPVPWYVGLAKDQPLGLECFERDKLRKYSAAMFGRRGSPTLTFLTADNAPSVKRIDKLETLLIWIARAKNPNLLNERKVSGQPRSIISLMDEIRIHGVLNRTQGKPTQAAVKFQGMIGL